MPHRKLVNIGETPKMPTIRDFLTDMAARQRDEIRRLKDEALGRDETKEVHAPTDPADIVVPDPWLLHPVRVKSKKKPAKKSAKKSAKRVAGKKKTAAKKATAKRILKKAAKRVAKKAAKKSAAKRPAKKRVAKKAVRRR